MALKREKGRKLTKMSVGLGDGYAGRLEPYLLFPTLNAKTYLHLLLEAALVFYSPVSAILEFHDFLEVKIHFTLVK